MAMILTNRNYRLLFSASAISNLGDGISVLAFPWLASLITRDAGMVALVAFAGRIPWLLLSIPAGVITDRMDRARLIVQADVLRLLLTLGVIAVIFSLPDLPPPGSPLPYISALAALAFLLGSAEVLRDNAAQTMLPSVVDKSDLERANGQIWSIEQIMGSFVGPPLAGVLIALALPAPFALDALTFGLAAWLVWCMVLPPFAAPLRRPLKVEVAEAWQWLRQHPVVLRLAVMLGLMNAFALMGITILVLFAQDVLGLNATGHGLLLTAAAAGGVLGGLYCPALATRLGAQRSLWLALAILPISMAMIAVATHWSVVALALFIEMGAAMLWNVVTVSYRQRLIPDAMLGRVNSLYRFFGWGIAPIGALIAGAVVTLVEPDLGRDIALRAPYALAAFGGFLMTAYGCWKLRL
tara:strand:- start:69414 stop:70646 length:1233 start_codon:yes stop_codon:yes gene_type:complete